MEAEESVVILKVTVSCLVSFKLYFGLLYFGTNI